MTKEVKKEVVCPICAGALKWPFKHNQDIKIEADISAFNPGVDYRWWLCRTCGNAYPTFMPSLSVLAKVWQKNRDLSEADPAREEEIWRYRKTISEKGARRSFDFLLPLYQKPPGRFLDIGCGLGETVRLFAERGWDALGVDADPSTRRFHEAIGIRSVIGQAETLDLGSRFDIIHTAHAIYFVTNVRGFLASLRDRLSEGGLLCVVLADFLSSDDPGLPGYSHSFYPTASSMRYLLALEGFQVVRCKKMSGSIFMAARRADGPLPPIHPWLIRIGHESKPLRYALVGRPVTILKSLVKRVLSIVRPGM